MYNDDWMDPEPEEEVEPINPEGDKGPNYLMNAILGPCPICKKVKWWYNDLPLRAFCWGSPDDEHKEVPYKGPPVGTYAYTAWLMAQSGMDPDEADAWKDEMKERDF